MLTKGVLHWVLTNILNQYLCTLDQCFISNWSTCPLTVQVVSWFTDWQIDFILPCICLTSRFPVAVHLFSNRSYRWQQNVVRIKQWHTISQCITDVLTTFWHLLWSVTEQTHGNMESVLVFLKCPYSQKVILGFHHLYNI